MDLYSQVLVLKMPTLKQKLGNPHKEVPQLVKGFFEKHEFRELVSEGQSIFFNLFLVTFFLDQQSERKLIFKAFS